jgi:hypothetical protein
MSNNPPTLVALGNYVVAVGWTNSGVVGNIETHCGGYHLGKDRIFGPCACKPKPDGICKPGRGQDDRSVKLARDVVGLSDSASAFDLGPIDDHSLPQLRALSDWIVQECRKSAPDTLDIREIIFTPSRFPAPGGTVHTWDRQLGVTSQPVVAGDATHLTHTHFSFYRNSEAADKTGPFRRYFSEVAMNKITDKSLRLVDVAAGTAQFALDGVTPAGKSDVRLETASPFACGALRAVYISKGDGTTSLVLTTPSKVHPPEATTAPAPLRGPASPDADAAFNEGVDAAAAAALTARRP